MKIVLLQRIEKLGRLGEVVTVKDGYARNFLLPQKKALRATAANIKYFEDQRSHLEAQNHHSQEKAEKFAHKLEGFKLIIIRQASEGGILYGSVSTRDIAKMISAQGEMVAAVQVKLPQPIKTVGIHHIPIQLHADVKVEVVASIAPSQEEAEAQLNPAPVDEASEETGLKKKTSKKHKKEAEEIVAEIEIDEPAAE